MIILHIPSWFPSAEAPFQGNFILRQIATVSARTTSIVLHHAKEDFPTECLSPNESIKYHLIRTENTSKAHLFKLYLQAYREICKTYGKPDIIHLHVAMPMGAVAAYIAQRHHIPLIISEHWSIYQPQNRDQINWKQQLMFCYIYRTAKSLTTVSENLRNAIVGAVPIARKTPYKVISNVVDTDVFKPIDTVPCSIKQILHISTLDNEAKNIMGILRAVKALRQRRNDFRLNIIHDLRNIAVEEFIEKNQLENHIVLLGKKVEADVAAAIQRCDFLLLFSNYENQPCVILESHCCGKPVLTTPVGGIPEICDNENALFVESKNEEQLVDSLDYMLDHASNYEPHEISTKASRKYAKETIGNQFIDLYRSLVQTF